MRVFISLIVGIIAIVLSATLVIFAMQNIEAAPLHFLPYSFTGNIAAVIVGSAILGFVVAVLLMTPGRIAEILHDRHLTERVEQATEHVSDAQRRQASAEASRRESQQQSQRLQKQLRQLVSEREDLVAERDRLRAERNKFRHQLAITQTELPAVAARDDITAAKTQPWSSSKSDVNVADEDEAGTYPEDAEATPDRFDTNPSVDGQSAQADSIGDFEDSDQDDELDDELSDESPARESLPA